MHRMADRATQTILASEGNTTGRGSPDRQMHVPHAARRRAGLNNNCRMTPCPRASCRRGACRRASSHRCALRPSSSLPPRAISNQSHPDRAVASDSDVLAWCCDSDRALPSLSAIRESSAECDAGQFREQDGGDMLHALTGVRAPRLTATALLQRFHASTSNARRAPRCGTCANTRRPPQAAPREQPPRHSGGCGELYMYAPCTTRELTGRGGWTFS